MKFLEVDLEEIIYNTNNDILVDRGLDIYGHKKRQLRIGNYGVADIVTIERPVKFPNELVRKGKITVYELKKDKISVSAFFQALGYLRGITRYLELREFDLLNFDLEICLIGKKVDADSSICYLGDLFENYTIQETTTKISLYEYGYDIDGLSFNTVSGYKLANEGFKL